MQGQEDARERRERAGWCVRDDHRLQGGWARGLHVLPRALPGAGVGEPLAAQERGDPSWLRDLFKYSVRNNGI